MKKAFVFLSALWLWPGIVSAAERAVAPEWLVRAIIQIESKGNPYAVHVGGKAH